MIFSHLQKIVSVLVSMHACWWPVLRITLQCDEFESTTFSEISSEQMDIFGSLLFIDEWEVILTNSTLDSMNTVKCWSFKFWLRAVGCAKTLESLYPGEDSNQSRLSLCESAEPLFYLLPFVLWVPSVVDICLTIKSLRVPIVTVFCVFLELCDVVSDCSVWISGHSE